MWTLLQYDFNFNKWKLIDNGSYDYCQEVKVKINSKYENYAKRLRIKNYKLLFKLIKVGA